MKKYTQYNKTKPKENVTSHTAPLNSIANSQGKGLIT